MKKIIYITCCFVFAGVCSSSEYTLSDSNDNPRAFNSSDSSINDDSKITTHAMNNPSRKRSRRSVDINQSSKIRKNKEVYTDLFEYYFANPKKFLNDLEKKRDNKSYIRDMLYTLEKYNFFCSDYWEIDDILACEKRLDELNLRSVKNIKFDMEWYLNTF